MGEASREAWKIIEQKRKYWHKALSEDAMWSVLTQSYNIFDWLSTFSDMTLSDTLWSSLISAILLGIPLKEVVPWNLVWDIELPSIEEFLKGVLIKLEKISIEDLAPEFKELLEEIYRALEDIYAEALKSSLLEKGVYGQSRYGFSYYDPIAVREFFRSTLYAFMKKKYDIRSVKVKVEESANTLKIHPELVRTLFDRLSAISVIKEGALTWDYGWWDRSNWGEEGSEGRVKYLNYDLQEQETPYEDLIDYHAGGFWDVAVWDYFYWLEEAPREVHPFRLEDYNIADLIEKVWLNFRSRISTIALALANYQTLKERTRWVESSRLETYALPVSQRMHLERLTESIVKSKEPNIDALKLRLYKSAVLQLFGDITSMHRWGTEMFSTMSEDELKQWWIEKWVKTGLDRDVLETLYTAVKSHISTYSTLRHKERLRFLRRRLLGVK